jgi:aconitate hydratase
MAETSCSHWSEEGGSAGAAVAAEPGEPDVPLAPTAIPERDGLVVIAAITSCTNTSNPSVMVGAGLLARRALAKGFRASRGSRPAWRPDPGWSRLPRGAGLMPDFESLGFNVVGYGCTTCIGNSGPLPEPVAEAIDQHQLVAAAVLSGNRNFEARIHPQVRANYLASPMLVVAFALAGRVDVDLITQPLGTGSDGRAVVPEGHLAIGGRIRATMAACLKPGALQGTLCVGVRGDDEWRTLEVPGGDRFAWNPESTYVQEPPFFRDWRPTPPPRPTSGGPGACDGGRISVTTDHISPAGAIPKNGPAARYLLEKGVPQGRMEHLRGPPGESPGHDAWHLGNVRIKNLLVPERRGTGPCTSRREKCCRSMMRPCAMPARHPGFSSWPARNTERLQSRLGRERDLAARSRACWRRATSGIHRSNLVGMGVLPLA